MPTMTQTVAVGRDTVVIPGDYAQLELMPDDPKGSVPVGVQTQQSMCFVRFVPISASQAMPFDRPQEVVDGIHGALEDDQGLVEVCAETMKSGRRLIDSIVKTMVSENGGMQYTWTCDMETQHGVVMLQGFFDEAGVTGIRETTVFELSRRDGSVTVDDSGVHGWARDVYDPAFTRGNLPNLSEDARYDGMFPEHPLSMLRAFRSVVAANN